jgi:hypothetical protein
MYYVLFETVETSFFDSIVEEYCVNFARWVRDTYQKLKRENGRINQDELNSELVNRFHDNRGHLQCLFFSLLMQCKNAPCKALHKCVLTKRQLKMIAEKLNEQKLIISRNSSEISQKDRIFFQSTFERCNNYVNDGIIYVHINHSTHPEYINAYVEFVNRHLLDKSPHFVYVRGTNSSDYDYFSRSIRSDVIPCDNFQTI